MGRTDSLADVVGVRVLNEGSKEWLDQNTDSGKVVPEQKPVSG
jgi:hypothetical protein